MLLIFAILAMPVALWIGDRLSAPFGYPAWRTSFQGKYLAREADVLWREQNFGERPLMIVLGDSWYGGNIAWYGEARPQVMINGSRSIAHG